MNLSYRLADIAARFGGRVLGDGEVRVIQVATLENAQSSHISFLTNSKYRTQLANTCAGAVILGEADAQATELPRIVSDNPYAYFARVSALINSLPEARPGVHPEATVGTGAQIDPTTRIAATAVIGDGAVIGAHSVIGEGCCIGENTVIGSHARLYPHVVIYHNCVIGDNTTIDRGAMDDTEIEDGVKLDNQIQVAHNVRIGAHTAIAGCAGIAGSAVIGRYCLIGGGARILGHLQLADHVEIAAHTLVGKSIREAGSYAAIFPFSKTEDWRRNAAHLRHLDDLVKRVKTLEQELEALKRK